MYTFRVKKKKKNAYNIVTYTNGFIEEYDVYFGTLTANKRGEKKNSKKKNRKADWHFLLLIFWNFKTRVEGQSM